MKIGYHQKLLQPMTNFPPGNFSLCLFFPVRPIENGGKEANFHFFGVENGIIPSWKRKKSSKKVTFGLLLFASCIMGCESHFHFLFSLPLCFFWVVFVFSIYLSLALPFCLSVCCWRIRQSLLCRVNDKYTLLILFFLLWQLLTANPSFSDVSKHHNLMCLLSLSTPREERPGRKAGGVF